MRIYREKLHGTITLDTIIDRQSKTLKVLLCHDWYRESN
jgi:hypothetical protein